MSLRFTGVYLTLTRQEAKSCRLRLQILLKYLNWRPVTATPVNLSFCLFFRRLTDSLWHSKWPQWIPRKTEEAVTLNAANNVSQTKWRALNWKQENNDHGLKICKDSRLPTEGRGRKESPDSHEPNSTTCIANMFMCALQTAGRKDWTLPGVGLRLKTLVNHCPWPALHPLNLSPTFRGQSSFPGGIGLLTLPHSPAANKSCRMGIYVSYSQNKTNKQRKKISNILHYSQTWPVSKSTWLEFFERSTNLHAEGATMATC